MKEKRREPLDKVSYPQSGEKISGDDPGPFKGSCDTTITGVTIEIDYTDGSIFMDEYPSPPFTPTDNTWSITLPGNALPLPASPYLPMEDVSAPLVANSLRCVARFYEGDILTTLLTTKFYTS